MDLELSGGAWRGEGQALLFDPRPLRLVAGGMARSLGPAAVLRAGGPLRLTTMPAPRLPGPDWVRLRPLRTGICGSDLTQVGMQADFDNPLTGIISFPHVMGHEIVARTVDVDGGGEAAGAVVVDPWMGCEVSGVAPSCDACAAGHPPLCAHAGDVAATHGRGMHLGNIEGLPGGFGAALIAHRSRVHPLPPGLPLELGVLADPLAVAAHALDRAALDTVEEGGAVLVLGAGTIGLSTVATVRARRPDLDVLVTARWAHLAEAARRLGATPLSDASGSVVEAVRRRCGGTARRPWRGGQWLSGGGAPVVVDAVGAAATLETALRVARPGGRVVSVGVARPRRFESTLLYFKEVTVMGSNGYGTAGIPRAIALLDSAPERFAPWLTHTFPLAAWRRAFRAAMQPERSRAVKVTLLAGDPGTEP